MGNSSPAPLGKIHVPDLEWKIHYFSALLETGAPSAYSYIFHCSGYTWCLKVTMMHKEHGFLTPYAALSLAPVEGRPEPGHTMNAVFELSIYNHSKKMYFGRRASYNFDVKNSYSDALLIPLQDLQKLSAFLVDDCCVFGVEILKIGVSSLEKKSIVVQKKATTVQNLFIQKKGFIEGTYSWTLNDFLVLDLKNFARSPTFEAGGHKWFLHMHPHGDWYRTDTLSLYLSLYASNELPCESGKVVINFTLSILDQKDGKHFT